MDAVSSQQPLWLFHLFPLTPILIAVTQFLMGPFLGSLRTRPILAAALLVPSPLYGVVVSTLSLVYAF